ncbi:MULTISPECIES: DUF2510 domain-containing protein [Nocardiaceae]|uniref:DUF2510 domain-containing protein n=1 Tax=Rhodococcoides corynebacterioides TaxID=53972 RepID=A0ABS2KV76_9NOCA|nr:MULTISPECIES: DUF2510 domain-containing protein [Rhodococcus]MBM7415847.1 hypothetical protein [Rhodococcus corynebacterioides]MBP1118309.1 hypothetical protein [Rhodococcus sp. PvP016]
MSEPHSGQPGWYPTPDGGQQYWDGQQWLNIPAPEASRPSVGHRNRKPGKKLILAVAVVVLVLVGAGAAAKFNHDSNVRQQEQAAQQAREEADQREAKRISDIQAEQERKDSAERLSRTLSVSGIETSVKQMAEGHVNKGLLDGPILSVSCSPVSGGSTDDLTETTTVFECFAANEDNGDGTMSGYKYNATMNWSSGEYTYGLGAP